MINKKWIGILSLALIIMVAALGCGSKSQSTESQKIKLTKEFKYDNKKTVEFIESFQIEKGFPLSVTYSYCYVYSMKALGRKIDDKYQKKVISFIKKSQKKDGGFARDQNTDRSDAYSTYCAVWVLKNLNALDQIDTSKVERFIKSCTNKDGGFGFMPGQESQPINTYYNVAALQMLGKISNVNRSSIIKYLNMLQVDQGGFSLRKGIPASVQSTYAALQTYKILDGLANVNKEKTVAFLEKDQMKDGGFGYMVGETNITNPENTFYALSSLRLLGALDKAKVGPLSRFLKDRYSPGDGGFGDVYYGNSKYPSTAYGISCLVELGVLRGSEIEN